MKNPNYLVMERYALKNKTINPLHILFLIYRIVGMILIIALSIYLIYLINNDGKVEYNDGDAGYFEEYSVSNIIYDSEPPVYEIKTLKNPAVEYLERCVQAEAGNQDVLGRIYVCDVILNRLDSGKWGDNLYDVINYPNAFTVVSNGMINNVEVTGETEWLVNEELTERTNSEILSFRTEHYHTIGTPCFKHGAHYFSK